MPLSLHLNPKPLQPKARLVDGNFQVISKTPVHSQLNEFQSSSSRRVIGENYQTQSFDRKQKNHLPTKSCEQEFSFINNSFIFKDQLLLMYIWQGPWFELGNHEVFCYPCQGVSVAGSFRCIFTGLLLAIEELLRPWWHFSLLWPWSGLLRSKRIYSTKKFYRLKQQDYLLSYYIQ